MNDYWNSTLKFTTLLDLMLILSGRTLKGNIMGGRSLTSHCPFQKPGHAAFSLEKKKKNGEVEVVGKIFLYERK